MTKTKEVKKESKAAMRKRLGYNPDLIIDLSPEKGMPRMWDRCHTVKTSNHSFEDILGITSIYGGSGGRVHLKSLITNKNYEMFISDFNDVVQAKMINKTAIKGTFAFTKKGAYAGLICVSIKDNKKDQ